MLQSPDQKIRNPRRCPALVPEHQRIHDDNAVLASTGCTKAFCQAGRAIHTDEPRIGENRALSEVEEEAKNYLQDLHAEGFYDNDDAFQTRLKKALGEIRDGAMEAVIRQSKAYGMVGGNWTQTSQELEFGVRRAWRNSRKCIMRSHVGDLKLCDLREARSSAQMIAELLKGISEAFNGGSILPTVFVFPPRTVNGRGPMFWNHQVLQFAGYEAEDGTTIGDPNSVELTKSIIELGWVPPVRKSPWDLLPLAGMAEGDCPAFAEIPANLRHLVHIRHPQYATQFQKIDLKWVSFPALTRLGFDIGGVQYTAAPFIGWFMDAEIGVRNLADTFRYNALPAVVRALKLTEGKLGHGVEVFEDLPEYEKLSMLSRAQTELNYAVHWSFTQAKISISDSLTASMKWCKFDDEFKEMHGYRLPADPYWLAPPQGSIIPVWHRGGAPNYQPKPMISKHVQDPIKAWGREKDRWSVRLHPLAAVVELQGATHHPVESSCEAKVLDYGVADELDPLGDSITPLSSIENEQDLQIASGSVAIYFCSAGTLAERLATKVHQWITSHPEPVPGVSLQSGVNPLNSLQVSDLVANKTVLLVVSTTGHGDIPANGLFFYESISELLSNSLLPPCRFNFAIFGNGDSRYSTTYNGAAIKIHSLMKRIGGRPLIREIWQGDTATEPLPVRALSLWWKKLQPVVNGMLTSLEEDKPAEDPVQKYDDHQQEVLSTLEDSTLVATVPEVETEGDRSLLVSLNLGNVTLEEMSCIQVFPFNAPAKVDHALRALHAESTTQMNLALDGEDPTFGEFLKEYVDLERPFLELEWLKSVPLATQRGLTSQALANLSVLEVLARLLGSAFTEDPTLDYCLQRDICLDMPLLQVKTYSLASSPSYASTCSGTPTGTDQQIEIMVKVNEEGRFSETFLRDFAAPTSLKYRFIDSRAGPRLRENHLAPYIVVATGAGFGPVRCLLQWRIATTRQALAQGQPLSTPIKGISLFLGLKHCDLELISDILDEAKSLNIIELLEIVPSNPEKKRVYEELPHHTKHIRSKLVKDKGLVFVCTSQAAAKSTRAIIEKVLGVDVEKMLGERYVEEVF